MLPPTLLLTGAGAGSGLAFSTEETVELANSEPFSLPLAKLTPEAHCYRFVVGRQQGETGSVLFPDGDSSYICLLYTSLFYSFNLSVTPYLCLRNHKTEKI